MPSQDIIFYAALVAVLASCVIFALEALRAPRGRKKRDKAAYCAPHPGRGVFDDFAWLFNEQERAGASQWKIWAAEAAFQSIFRLSVTEFTFVAKHINGSLRRRRDRRGRKPIPVHIIIAAALVYLAHGVTYKMTAIAVRNGLSEATVLRSVRLFTTAVRSKLAPHFIKFPSTRVAMNRISRSFEWRSGIPNILGAIDGSHIRVPPPKRKQKSYFNRKSFYSIILSAVVDARGFFMSVDVGYPGRMSDSKVLRYCELYRKAQTWFGRFGYYIYGDAAYPLRSWLLVGFRNPANADEEKFNELGSKARVIVECAFGKLKGQWRCLMSGLKTRDTQSWNDIVITCCCLHNITIELSGAGWAWNAGVHRGERDPSDPANALGDDPNAIDGHNPFDRLRDDADGKALRSRIFDYLKTKEYI